MRPAIALLALAVVVLAAWSRAGNTRSVKGARLTAGDHGAPDDSEVVGMPTTWVVGDYGPETFSAADPLGPGWYVELAPTSRN